MGNGQFTVLLVSGKNLHIQWLSSKRSNNFPNILKVMDIKRLKQAQEDSVLLKLIAINPALTYRYTDSADFVDKVQIINYEFLLDIDKNSGCEVQINHEINQPLTLIYDTNKCDHSWLIAPLRIDMLEIETLNTAFNTAMDKQEKASAELNLKT